MKPVLVGSVWALGFASILVAGCSRNSHDRTADQGNEDPSGTDQRRAQRAEPPRLVRDNDERRAQSHSDEPKGGGAGFIGGGPRESNFNMNNRAAILSIAAARCDREARCDRVGPGEKYDSRRECMVDIKRNERSDLSDDACPGGISPKGLDGCLQSIREEDCKNPLETIGRLNACRTGDLCLR